MKQAESSLIAVHAMLKSSRNVIERYTEDAAGKKWIRVRVTDTLEDGKANALLLKLLAKEWACPTSSLTIENGLKSRRKLIRKN